jgi:hypothetical protein
MDSMVDEKRQPVSSPPLVVDEAIGDIGELVNTSGHVQELDRNFGFWSICAISIVADNAWAAGGGSLVCPLSSCTGAGGFGGRGPRRSYHANFRLSGKVVAFYDGGAPGVLYEL